MTFDGRSQRCPCHRLRAAEAAAGDKSCGARGIKVPSWMRAPVSLRTWVKSGLRERLAPWPLSHKQQTFSSPIGRVRFVPRADIPAFIRLPDQRGLAARSELSTRVLSRFLN